MTKAASGRIVGMVIIRLPGGEQHPTLPGFGPTGGRTQQFMQTGPVGQGLQVVQNQQRRNPLQGHLGSLRIQKALIQHSRQGTDCHPDRINPLKTGKADKTDPPKKPCTQQPISCLQRKIGLALTAETGDGKTTSSLHCKGPFNSPEFTGSPEEARLLHLRQIMLLIWFRDFAPILPTQQRTIWSSLIQGRQEPVVQLQGHALIAAKTAQPLTPLGIIKQGGAGII
ncbi:MAG: hypothetical protein D3903_17735, partial [Candidatus Electrothrix sp. GM3_4]|nr:hypothetical protein [Candidatus Electrothrix sp. GM3_4]